MEVLRVLYPFPGIEDHGRGLLEEELVPGPDPGDHGELPEPVVDDLQDDRAQLLHSGKGVRVEDPEPLREDAVAQVQLRPHREIVPIVGIVERRPERGFAEMVVHGVPVACGDPVPQLPQVHRGGQAAHPHEQGAILDFERFHPAPASPKYDSLTGGHDSQTTEYFSIILPTIKPPSCSGMITSSAPEFRMAWA